MYNNRICFYFLGDNPTLFNAVKALSPIANCSCEFKESLSFDKALAAAANVIIFNMAGKNSLDELNKIVDSKSPKAELIISAEKSLIPSLKDYEKEISDIWAMPMEKEEMDFRLSKWQKSRMEKEEALLNSEYLNAVINGSPNLIWFKSKDGIHTKVNDSFCRTVKKTKSQVEGQRHPYIWNVEQEDPACIESDNRVLTEKKMLISEETIDTGDGLRLLTTYKSPLIGGDGNAFGTVGIGVDITREKEYENEIINRSRTLEKVFSTIDCGVMCHSMNGKHILSVNEAALKILGYDSQKELEENFNFIADTVSENDKERMKQQILSLKKEGESISIEYDVCHKDGQVRNVMGDIKVLKENGRLFIRRYLLDVTAERQQIKELEKQQLELVQALGIDFNLICSFDLDTGEGSGLRVNDCKYHILQNLFNTKDTLTLDGNLGKYIDTCVYSEDKEKMRQICSFPYLKEELANKRFFHINYRTFCGNKIKYFQMKAVRTGDWQENKHGVVLGFRSIDEEMRREMEKKSLLEDALMQANRANKAKSTFLSNMSHDIRTPMNAIVGFTSMAMNRIDKKEQVEEYLKKIMTSSNHLLGLINDVLDMSRIESGKMHLDEKPCSLSEILRSIKSILQADIRAKQLTFNISAADIVHEDVICDKLRLNQVLLNLMSNAVKYTPQGGKIDFILAEKPSDIEGKGSYEFTVRDNGIGMTEEFLAHIFEPFERERNSTTSGIQGTGLGMAITKNIVDMMGGTITIQSKKNEGTECKTAFIFTLNDQAGEQTEIPQFKNCRALVVDDDFNTCDSVSYMLQQMGIRGEWTLSGKEAVLRTKQAQMRGDNYGIYIVDCFLPDMNGIEVVRRIRKHIGKEVPVIILTAYDWTEIEDEAREAGVNAFCSKPMFMSELRQCLSSISNSDDKEKKKASEIIRSGRILLTEDNELNQEIAVAILEEAGFTVEVANNGEEAVDKISHSEAGYYQIILMDIQMPVMNGYEATKKIRALDNKELANIPILAMTANAFEEDKQEALHCGMNGHLSKPIDVNALLETLDNILG